MLKGLMILTLYVGIFFTAEPPVRDDRTYRFVVAPSILQHMSFGQELLFADLLWIRLIQEIDFSEQQGSVINKGWTFHMLDAITTLDPRYYMAYRAGLTVLSVVIRDVEGSQVLYERAILNYPNDWTLHYRAAYHYLYEVKNCKRAAELLDQASKLGAPPWVAVLSGRLFSLAGQKDLARSVLTDALERFKGTELEPRLKQRLSDLDSASSNLSAEISCQP